MSPLFPAGVEVTLSPVSCPWWSPTSLTHHIPLTVTCAQSLAECLCNKKVTSLWAPPTMSLYVCVTLLTNHQQICVLTCAQPTWSLTEFFPYSADHSPTLWPHRGQKASGFLCTKTTLFGETWATKNIAKKTWKCSLRRATNVVFSKSRGWRREKKTGFLKWF